MNLRIYLLIGDNCNIFSDSHMQMKVLHLALKSALY